MIIMALRKESLRRVKKGEKGEISTLLRGNIKSRLILLETPCNYAHVAIHMLQCVAELYSVPLICLTCYMHVLKVCTFNNIDHLGYIYINP